MRCGRGPLQSMIALSDSMSVCYAATLGFAVLSWDSWSPAETEVGFQGKSMSHELTQTAI